MVIVLDDVASFVLPFLGLSLELYCSVTTSIIETICWVVVLNGFRFEFVT